MDMRTRLILERKAPGGRMANAMRRVSRATARRLGLAKRSKRGLLPAGGSSLHANRARAGARADAVTGGMLATGATIAGASGLPHVAGGMGLGAVRSIGRAARRSRARKYLETRHRRGALPGSRKRRVRVYR